MLQTVSQESIRLCMGARLSRLAPSVTASTHTASSSSTAATPPQFLAAQKASAVIDASRRALLDNDDQPHNAVKDFSGSPSEDKFVSGPRSARLQDALGRGGGGGQDGEGGAVTQEQLRSAYSMQMVTKFACVMQFINFLFVLQYLNLARQNGHSSRTASDNAHIGKTASAARSSLVSV